MAVNLGIGQRNMKSGIQGNRKTAQIPTGPSRTVGVANDPGVAGGPSSIPAGAFGPDGNVDAGRQIQAGANTIIADEVRAQRALAAEQGREFAKTETVFLTTLTNKYKTEIEHLDLKYNPLNLSADEKARQAYQSEADKILKSAEGRSQNFKDRLALQLEQKADTQLAAVRLTGEKQRDELYKDPVSTQLAVLAGRADGKTVEEDLLTLEELTFPLREGLALDAWADYRLAEAQKLVGAHFRALTGFPTKANKAMFNHLANDPVIQGIMGGKIVEAKLKILEAEQLAANRRSNDPVEQAVSRLAAVDKALIAKGAKPTDAVQAAQIISANFKLSPSQEADADEVKRAAKINFIKTNLNKILAANDLPPMNATQEAQLEASGVYTLSATERGKEAGIEQNAKAEIIKEEINKILIADNKPPMNATQEANLAASGVFEASAVEQGVQKGMEDLARLETMVGKENVTSEMKKRAALPTGGTTINIDPKEKAFGSQTGNKQADMLAENITTAGTAVNTGRQLESIREGLKTYSFEPGAFAETRVFFSTVAELVENVTGADLTKLKKTLGSAPTGNLMDTAAKNLTLEMAKNVGRITNMSLHYSEQSAPGLFRTRAGMEIVVEILQRKVDRDKHIGRLSEEAQRDGVFPEKGPSFYEKVRAYDKTHPVFDAALKKRMLAITNKGKRKAAQVKASEVTIEPPKPPGFTYQATIEGYHVYKGDDGKAYRMPVEGSPNEETSDTGKEETSDTPVALENKPDSNVSLEQVQSIISDLAQNVDQKTLSNIMSEVQNLFSGGKK